MSFVILRTAKLKNAGSIGASLGHNYRIMDTPNADKSLTHLNEHECSLEQVKQNIENRLPENIRKNGVRVIEYLITASPEWKGWGTDAETEFFDQAKKWLREKHGSENVVGLSIHRDETTPHLVAYIVPIDPAGKLNARHFLGGREKLSEMQTDFSERVSHIGLERGIKGSRAKHTKVKQFYSDLEKPVKQLPEIQLTRLNEQPKAALLDSKQAHGERVIDAVYDHIAPQFEQYEKQIGAEFSALTAQLNDEKNKNKKLKKQVTELAQVSQTLKSIISDYDEEYSVFQDLRGISEIKYQDLKKQAQAEIDLQLQKENEGLRLTVTAKTDIEKQLDSALKHAQTAPVQVKHDQVRQNDKKQEKGSDLDFKM